MTFGEYYETRDDVPIGTIFYDPAYFCFREVVGYCGDASLNTRMIAMREVGTDMYVPIQGDFVEEGECTRKFVVRSQTWGQEKSKCHIWDGNPVNIPTDSRSVKYNQDHYGYIRKGMKMDFKSEFDKIASTKKSVPSFIEQVNQIRKNNHISKATATDMRDAEIFGQIADLLRQVSVKNRKNLNDLLATFNFSQRGDADKTIYAFDDAKQKAQEGSKTWWE